MLEDSILIEKLKAGNRSAFNELVGLYRNRVINTCYKFLLDREEAEDISQEVFLEVYQSIKFFRGDSKLSTWILRIAVSKSLDEIKKRKRSSLLNPFPRLSSIRLKPRCASIPNRTSSFIERVTSLVSKNKLRIRNYYILLQKRVLGTF